MEKYISDSLAAKIVRPFREKEGWLSPPLY